MKKIILLIVASMLSINAYCQCTEVIVNIETEGGLWPEEMTWIIVNPEGNTLVEFEGTQNVEYQQSVACLSEGCYALIGYDSWGDGWNGGSVTMSYNSTIVNFELVDEISVGVLSFAIGQEVENCDYSFYGCTYGYAYNYDAEALIDDGTCIYPGESAGDCNEGQIIHAKTTTNYWSEEVSWTLSNEANEIIYEYESPGNYMITVDSICVNTDCYLITLEDSYGDGWLGDFLEIDLNEDTEYDVSETVYAYTSYLTFEIDIDPCDIELVGCTDPYAVNYVAGANQDDGTCITPFVYTHNGIDRTYWLTIPKTLNTRIPLLIDLHGYGGTGYWSSEYSDMPAIANEQGFVACYPQGTYDMWGNGFWNANLDTNEIDDVDFLVKLTKYLQSEYDLDPNRTFVSGFANGGFMAYALACKASNTFSAIASVSGSMSEVIWNDCNAENPVSIMQVCGTNDTTVPMAGGNGVPNIYQVIDSWTTFNNTQNTSTEYIGEGPWNTEVTCHTDGTDGSQVRLYVVNGMGYDWPTVANQGWSCDEEIWEFFTAVSNPVSLEEIDQTTKRTLIKRVDLLGREVKSNAKHGVFIDLYDDGTAKKSIIINKAE